MILRSPIDLWEYRSVLESESNQIWVSSLVNVDKGSAHTFRLLSDGSKGCITTDVAVTFVHVGNISGPWRVISYDNT